MHFSLSNAVFAAICTVSFLAPGTAAGGSLAAKGIAEELGKAVAEIIINPGRRRQAPISHANIGLAGLALQYAKTLDSCNIAVAGAAATNIQLVNGSKNKLRLSGLPPACIEAQKAWNSIPGIAGLNELYGAGEIKGQDVLELTLPQPLVAWLDNNSALYAGLPSAGRQSD